MKQIQKPDFEKLATELFVVVDDNGNASGPQPVVLQVAAEKGMEHLWNTHVLPLLEEMEKQVINWQLCPKCEGQGRVTKPPYLAAGINEWASSQLDFECPVCNGKRLILPYVSPPQVLDIKQ